MEALRYVFGYNRTLEEIDKLQGGIRDLQKANLAGALIRVAYRTAQGEDRILSATYDPKSEYDTKVYTIDGDYLPVADIEASGEFPLRLFGWSEIETLGRSPARQRDLLDRLVPELRALLSHRKSLRNDLQANRGAVKKAVADLQATLARNNGEIRRFSEYKSDLDKLNTPQVKSLFASLDSANAKRKVLLHLASNLARAIESLRAAAPTTLLAGIDELISSDASLREWWVTIEAIFLTVDATAKAATDTVTQAIAKLDRFSALVAERVAIQAQDIETINAQLQSQFVANESMQKILDLRKNSADRLERATALRSKYLSEWKALTDVLNQRDTIATELAEAQLGIGTLRKTHNVKNEETLNRFLPDWMKVSIDFRAGGDTEEFAKLLKEIFAARGNTPKRIRQTIESHVDPVSFGRMCRTSDMSTLLGKTGP